MDGRIARLACTATVVAGEARSAARAEAVLRAELPAALPAALERALAGDPTVYVARSLHCEVHAGPAATGDTLARSIAAQLARSVRDPDRDGTSLVRFASTADYLAAFLAALARGDAWNRWYFGPLRRFARMGLPAVFLALDAEGNDMAPVLSALHRCGGLGPVATAIGEEALAQAWPSPRRARPQQAEWLSLVRLALDLARALGWDTVGHQDLQAVAAELAADADADLDWADPVGLARALASAVQLVSALDAEAGERSAYQLPAWLDWADTETLVRSLSGGPRPALPPGPPPDAPPVVGRPPRTQAVEAIVAGLITSGAVVIDRECPTVGSVLLWAALIERMPELAEAAWARDVVKRFVAQQLADPGQAAADGTGLPARRAGIIDVPCAGVYLLLRTLDAIRMPELCQRSGVPPAWLLQLLARRWAGPDVRAEDLADALRPVTGPVGLWREPPPADACRGLQEEVARIAMAQGGDDPGRAIPQADLTALAHGHNGDPQAELALDLIALTVLRAWAQWLRGFSTASVPFLLATFVRRPGRVSAVDDGTLRVSLDSLAHDIVLEVSGCMAPFELRWPWRPVSATAAVADRPVRPVRRVEFTVEA
jgi:hypothetical protein